MTRVQRSRAKGWRMPPDTVYVGRPSPWGNFHRPGDTYAFVPELPDYIDRTGDIWTWLRGRPIVTPVDLVEAFRQDAGLLDTREIERWVGPLRGKNLACWCPLDRPCHADVLLDLLATVFERSALGSAVVDGPEVTR